MLLFVLLLSVCGAGAILQDVFVHYDQRQTLCHRHLGLTGTPSDSCVLWCGTCFQVGNITVQDLYECIEIEAYPVTHKKSSMASYYGQTLYNVKNVILTKITYFCYMV